MGQSSIQQPKACQVGMCFFLADEHSQYCKHHRPSMEAYDAKKATLPSVPQQGQAQELIISVRNKLEAAVNYKEYEGTFADMVTELNLALAASRSEVATPHVFSYSAERLRAECSCGWTWQDCGEEFGRREWTEHAGAPAAGSTEREKFVQEAVDYLKGMAKLYHRDGEHTAGSTLNKVAIGIVPALAQTDTGVPKEPHG